MPSVPALARWKAEDHEFKILSGYTGSSEPAFVT